VLKTGRVKKENSRWDKPIRGVIKMGECIECGNETGNVCPKCGEFVCKSCKDDHFCSGDMSEETDEEKW